MAAATNGTLAVSAVPAVASIASAKEAKGKSVGKRASAVANGPPKKPKLLTVTDAEDKLLTDPEATEGDEVEENVDDSVVALDGDQQHSAVANAHRAQSAAGDLLVALICFVCKLAMSTKKLSRKYGTKIMRGLLQLRKELAEGG